MKNKAVNALIEMGMPANIKGFQYIAEAMELIEAEAGWRPGTGNITKLYQKLAEMYGDTPSRVERAIRHAFSIVVRSIGKSIRYWFIINSGWIFYFQDSCSFDTIADNVNRCLRCSTSDAESPLLKIKNDALHHNNQLI